MAHTCPECGQTCHCSGDIDDICFGPSYGCCHCDPDEGEDDDEYDYYKDQLSILDDPDQEVEDNNPNDSRNL